MNEDKQFLKAKDYTYKLLSYRQRSVQEIKQRLEKKGFTPSIIKKTIDYLSQLNYLNDENFARFWVRTKIQLRPVGWSLLRYQLKQKGISSEVVEKVFSECANQYNEYDAAKQIVSSKRIRYQGLEPLKLKRRLYAYLRRRGFSQDVIMQAIK